ncbi:hypothetical protein LINPERPRIM_LOCUS15631 [Linum perenne]
MSFKEAKRAIAPSADLLACFPPRSHLTLIPKRICSPARSGVNNSSEPNRNRRPHHRRYPSAGAGRHQASPLQRGKTKLMSLDVSEPTSPKVTCAGQIKVRHRAGSWQSVMEGIERIHHKQRKQRKTRSSSWIESLGFKKDAVQFLSCLRNIRFDLRCFGSFPQPSDINSDDEDAEEEEAEETEDSRAVFSKWFMVLQEEKEIKNFNSSNCVESVPPANALLLMRCRSAPAKTTGKNLKTLMEEEEKEEAEMDRLLVMRYDDADFYKISCDVAKETWVVGGMGDTLTRSRSWKR